MEVLEETIVPKESIEQTLARMKGEMARLDEEIAKRKQSFSESMKAHFVSSVWKDIREDKISEFVRHPFFVQPYRDQKGEVVENEFRLVVHDFLPLHVGWLEYSKDGWNVFRISKYVDWLSPLPDALREDLAIYQPSLGLSLDLDKSLLEISRGTALEVKKKYGAFLGAQVGANSFAVKANRKFDFMLEMLKDGIKPFVKKPFDRKMLFSENRTDFELREYQQEAWEFFLEYSNIGVFYPPGAGKTQLGLYALGKVRGKKLVIVPSVVLKQQWEKNWAEHIRGKEQGECEIVAYAASSNERIKKTEYSLIIADEVHRWPADTYSRSAFLKRSGTIGLSATPYREDGRSELIFGLCGFPVGKDWSYFWDKGIVKKPVVTVLIVRGFNEKIAELETLLRSHAVTLVYCDGVEHGKMLAARLKCQFVYGETRKVLQTITRELDTRGLLVVSRVGDEGMSLPHIQRVIEFEFLFGSRAQEAQRMGRLFHAEDEGEHYVLMTAEEFASYKKRLFGIEEKGIEVKVESRI